MTDRAQILTDAKFGSRIAEEESDLLKTYFFETEQWRKILADEIDIVFGAKGAGKSAVYSLLVAQRESFRLGRRITFLAAENPRGTPAFRDLTTEPPLSEEEFRGLWKLYFLSLTASYVRLHLDHYPHLRNADANAVITSLIEHGLMDAQWSLMTRLKAAFSYIRDRFKIETTVTEPQSGIAVTTKISLKEPSAEERRNGVRSLDDLLKQLNSACTALGLTVWLLLDRLDVAFADTDELERNAIRSLFRAYLDMMPLQTIKLKIFLRDDIWRKVNEGGFREASHITRSLTISWDKQSLLNVLVRRMLVNESICSHFGVKPQEVLADARLQEEFFYKLFPMQVEIGEKKSTTLDWMVSRTADATKRTAPRELIHLLLQSRDEQLRMYQLGVSNPEGGRLFEASAIDAAFPAVSTARYNLTLCAENASLKPFLDKLEREKTNQNPGTLARIWSCTITEALSIAEKLVEVGFFEKRGSKDAPTFWVPFLYRDALSMRQGSA